MEQSSGTTESVWLKSADFQASDALTQSHCDVCVIGGGVAGLSCAYQLCQEGLSVILLDDGPLAGGESCRTTAHLSSAVDDLFSEIERLHGKKGSRVTYESHAAAIDHIEEIIDKEGIDCDFQRLDGFLIPADNMDEDAMREEHEAAVRAGFHDAEYPARSPLQTITPRPCIRFPRQAQFDLVKYLVGVAKAVQRDGGKLVTNEAVAEVSEKDDTVTIRLANGAALTAHHAVVATNAPIVSLTIQVRQAPYRSYVISADIPPTAVPPALYWDTLDPYHYVRLQKGELADDGEVDQIIIGGEDHKTGMEHDAEVRFEKLLEWARPRFPGIGTVRHKWSGQIMEPVDCVAFIGKVPGQSHIYMTTGDSGMGVTHSVIASLLITDLIQGRDNAWAELYSPNRVTLKSLPAMLKENFTSVSRLGAQLTPGEVKSRDDIAPGSAAVIRHGPRKVGVYRDDSGAFHEVSATCTHLGCVVEWNPLEKSWDCPCHGSRFDVEGKILNGPATTPLPPAEEQASPN